MALGPWKRGISQFPAEDKATVETLLRIPVVGELVNHLELGYH